MTKINFKIIDITCGVCVKLSSLALKKISGVQNVEVRSDGSTMIESDREIAQEEIKNVLIKVGKTAIF